MSCPDNYDMFLAHDARQEAELDRLPECEWCGEKIQDEYCYNINGDLVCSACLENCRVSTEDYM